MSRFADIILPLPLDGVFTYRIPDEMDAKLKIGMRVAVPFGAKKIYTGIVHYIHVIEPTVVNVKEIIALLDDAPVVRRPQLPFWEWIAHYYMCSLGDVYAAAVPAGLKLESETLVKINPDFIADAPFNEKATHLFHALTDEKPHSIGELTKSAGFKNILPTVKWLLDKEAITLSEELKTAYKPHKETYVRLGENAQTGDELQSQFDKLTRFPKQTRILMGYLELSGYQSKESVREISQKELIAHLGLPDASSVKTLEKKGILQLYSKEISRLSNKAVATQPLATLNVYQKTACNAIKEQFKEKNVVLLHGVTSSGKTEIYAHLIEEILRLGRQSLYLVPEIALTAQLTQRLATVFGNKLGIYHSRFSDNERVEIWNNLLHNKGYDVILGVRSSIFLPFRDLGLVIVDEEHENSYKQYDPAPRYHARNAAIVLASMHGAKVVLGSATPAVETYQNAQSGKYGLAELTHRYEELPMPEIHLIDMKEAYRKKQFEGHFSDEMVEKMNEALQHREQIILFHNRRGYAPYIECKQCAYVPRCPHCDVSLTLHKRFDKLTCHYCGYTASVPTTCPDCQTPSLATKGFGTEQIEDELQALFPQAVAARLDLDSARTKRSFEKIIRDFETHKTDILIGTQMITKGFDFSEVSLVGILNAGNLLYYPDFRANERAFQLLSQVSGRAGRKNRQGLVLIQTPDTQHPVIQQVLNNDYKQMFVTQMQERHTFRYPPYVRLVNIVVKHRDPYCNNDAAADIAQRLRVLFGERVLGPNEPPVGRIQNWYIKHVLMKIETSVHIETAKKLIAETIVTVKTNKRFQSVQIYCDVDPM